MIGLPGGEHLPGNTDIRILSKYMCSDVLLFDSCAQGTFSPSSLEGFNCPTLNLHYIVSFLFQKKMHGIQA